MKAVQLFSGETRRSSIRIHPTGPFMRGVPLTVQTRSRDKVPVVRHAVFPIAFSCRPSALTGVTNKLIGS